MAKQRFFALKVYSTFFYVMGLLIIAAFGVLGLATTIGVAAGIPGKNLILSGVLCIILGFSLGIPMMAFGQVFAVLLAIEKNTRLIADRHK